MDPRASHAAPLLTTLNGSHQLSAVSYMLLRADHLCCTEDEHVLLQHRGRLGVLQEDVPGDTALQLAGAAHMFCSAAVLMAKHTRLGHHS